MCPPCYWMLCPASRGLVSCFRLLHGVSVFPGPCLPSLPSCLSSCCWMLCPPSRALVFLLVSLLFFVLVSLLVSVCWMLLPPSGGLVWLVFLPVSLLVSRCWMLYPSFGGLVSLVSLCCMLCPPTQGLLSLASSPLVPIFFASVGHCVCLFVSLLVSLLASLCWMVRLPSRRSLLVSLCWMPSPPFGRLVSLFLFPSLLPFVGCCVHVSEALFPFVSLLVSLLVSLSCMLRPTFKTILSLVSLLVSLLVFLFWLVRALRRLVSFFCIRSCFPFSSLPSRGIISLFPFVSLCCVHLSEGLPRLSPFLSPCFALYDAVSAFARPKALSPLSPLLFPLDAVSFPRSCLPFLSPPLLDAASAFPRPCHPSCLLLFSLLLDAVSAFQRPCLPCLPSCFPMLDAVSALPRPSHLSCFRSCFLLLPFPALCCMLCLPCQGLVSLPFLSPFVGSCVASSSRGVVSLLSLLVSTLLDVVSEALSPFFFPFLGSCARVPDAVSAFLSPFASPFLSPFLSRFWFPFVGCCVRLSGAVSPFLLPFVACRLRTLSPSSPRLVLFPLVGCCVRLSEALSPLFVFLFPLYWKPCICLSEVLSLCLFPVLFPRCWMPCRDPKALSSLYRLLFATAGSCWVSIPRSKGWYRVPPSSHYSQGSGNLGPLAPSVSHFVSRLCFPFTTLETCLPALSPSLAQCACFFQCVSPRLPTVSPSLSPSACPIWELFPTFPPACFPACLPLCAVCVSHLEPWNFACRFVFHLLPLCLCTA